MSVRTINDDAHFQSELSSAGSKLVVTDFSATWCGPCQRISPLYDQLPTKYPKAIFLKIDVDKCQEIAASQGVSSMPTFIFYRNKVRIDQLRGADIDALEAKIAQHVKASTDDNNEDYGQGMDEQVSLNSSAFEDGISTDHINEISSTQSLTLSSSGITMDLNPFIAKNQCECLNESDDHPMQHCLTSSGGYLQSDVDAQLILSLTFNQPVKIHSVIMKAPLTSGPKDCRLFINQPRTIDFDMAESCNSVQDLSVTTKDLDGTPINLKYVKFQNVQNVQLYVKNNLSDSDITQIDYLSFVGSPLQATKMEDFKRVSGKKGESH